MKNTKNCIGSCSNCEVTCEGCIADCIKDGKYIFKPQHSRNSQMQNNHSSAFKKLTHFMNQGLHSLLN